MSNKDQNEKIDHILDLLSKPLSRYVLSVLAGVDPGEFTGEKNSQNDNNDDEIDE